MSRSIKRQFEHQVLNHFQKTARTVKPVQDHQVEEELTSTNKCMVPAHQDVNVQERLESVRQAIDATKKVKDPIEKADHYKDVDLACFSIMNYLTPAEILNLLNDLMKCMGTRLAATYFYEKSIPHLILIAKSGLLCDHGKVQLLFYISLSSAKGAPFVNQLQFYLPDLEKLPMIEKIICASSYHKTSVPLPVRQSKAFREFSESECKLLLRHKSYLFSLTNTVETIKPGKTWLNELTKAVMNYKNLLRDFQTVAHLLSVYARTLTYEPNLLDQLFNSALLILMSGRGKHVHLEDLDKLLWSLSHLGFHMKGAESLCLMNAFRRKFEEYKEDDNLPLLVNSLLSLHMLHSWDKKIINTCFQENLFKKVMTTDYWKKRIRLQLLLSQIALEVRLKVPASLLEPVRVGYNPSKNVKFLFNIGLALVESGVASAAAIDLPIESLVIPGITLYTKMGKYHIDILDETTCIGKTGLPNGLMDLKMRLVPLKGYHHLLVTSDILKDRAMGSPAHIEKLMKDYLVYGKVATQFARAFAI
ncbi:hypothetical protein QAD02_022381 [Eretmocerus hayati]|uniref:Uncharacterized protein n=1 Tax=Eretmocerus hayati TaxID=131215 RepID=A0ACC2PT47_9HYME|nr:hypothetical protein QAD02_022381 [Eretmocerus hayati]